MLSEVRDIFFQISFLNGTIQYKTADRMTKKICKIATLSICVNSLPDRWRTKIVILPISENINIVARKGIKFDFFFLKQVDCIYTGMF